MVTMTEVHTIQLSKSDLYAKYDVAMQSGELEDSYTPEEEAWETLTLSWDDLVERGALELAVGCTVVGEDDEELVLGTEVLGFPSIDYVAGLPSNKDKTQEFNYQARGLQGSPGIYWQTYVSDPLVSSTVDAGYEGLVSGTWTVEPHEDTPDELSDRAELYAAWIKHELLDRESHWDDVLKAWNWGDKVFGFMLWEIIDSPDGGLEELQPRMPNRVKKWLFSEDGRRWVGTEMSYTGNEDVTIPADDLLLYSTGVGLDLEGQAKLRSLVRWVETKQLITQIEVSADESHGAGYIFVTPDGPFEDGDQADKVVEVLKGSTGKDVPIIKIGEGYGVQWLSPEGRLPDFESLRRYCDEQISLALQSTGSLVGLGSTGTYNLAEIKDAAEKIRRTRYFGQVVCKWINEHLIPRLVDNGLGGPVAPGLYPRLSFSLQSEAKDPKRYEHLALLKEAGMLTWTHDDENQIRDELDLAPLPESDTQHDDGDEDQDDEDDQEPVQEPAVESDDEHEDDQENDAAEIEASHCHYHEPTPETIAELAIRLGHWKPRPAELQLASYDPEKLSKWVMESNTEIGKEVAKIARRHRNEYVQLTAGVSDFGRLESIAQRMERKYLREYKQAIVYGLNRLAIKGSASQLRDLGALATKQGQLALPNVPKDVATAAKKYNLKRLSDQFHRHIDGQASRIARHSFNVTAAYLENNAVNELGPLAPERKKPQIPTESAYAKHARNYTMRTFNYGREETIKRIQAEAEARGFDDTRVVMEFSSIMEKDRSCEPCMDNDGRRYFLNSAEYERDKPPYYKHEGPADTCLCLMNGILPAESGYEDILEELNNGGSKVETNLDAFSNAPISGDPSSYLQALVVLAGDDTEYRRKPKDDDDA